MSTTTTEKKTVSRRHSPARHQRTWSRFIHLAGAAILGTFIYAPPVVADPLHLLLQVVIVPALLVTGLFLWQQGRLRRWAAGRDRRGVVREL